VAPVLKERLNIDAACAFVELSPQVDDALLGRELKVGIGERVPPLGEKLCQLALA
jgi:hypothetical protein